MLNRFPHFLLCAIAVLVLAGCDDRILPFQRDHVAKQSNILLLPDDQNYLRLELSGLGLPSAETQAIVNALSDQLRAAAIPVGGEELKGGHGFVMEAVYDAQGALKIYWVLMNETGFVYDEGFFSPALVFVEDQIEAPGSSIYDPLSFEIAKRIVEPVRDAFAKGRYIQAKDADLFDLDVVLGEIRNAPGDGNEALSNALITILSQAGMKTTTVDQINHNQSAALYLSAQVSSEKIDDEISVLSLQWRMEDDDGNDMGVMRQRNPIPTEAISGKWGVLAYEIAASMREAIAEQVANRKKTLQLQ